MKSITFQEFILFLVIKTLLISGNVILPNIISSNMVLQTNSENGNRAQLWGWTTKSGELVTVNFTEHGKKENLLVSMTVPSNSDTLHQHSLNEWKVQINHNQVGRIPAVDIYISGETGSIHVLLNIMFGDLYVCFGDGDNKFVSDQSKYLLSRTLADLKVLVPNDPTIRYFHMEPHTLTGLSKPQKNLPGAWRMINNTTLGDVSAFCYFSAVRSRSTHFTKNSAVGIVVATTNGSANLSSWSSPSALQSCAHIIYPTRNDIGHWKNEIDSSFAFNTLLYPLLWLRFRAMIVVFGAAEASTSQMKQLDISFYECLIQSTINDWRDLSLWGDWPVIMVQLGSPLTDEFTGVAEEEMWPSAAAVRFAQNSIRPCSKIQTTGLVVSADISNNISAIADRTVLELLHTTVGFSCKYITPTSLYACNPQVSSISVVSTIMNITFRRGGGENLTMKGTECDKSPFEILSNNGKWHNTFIKGVFPKDQTVTINLNGSYQAITVRYNWAMTPKCWFVNSDDLPVAPFVINMTSLRIPDVSQEVVDINEFSTQRFRNCTPHCTDNGLALKPPLGWETWNAFHATFGERLIRRTADYIVSSGMADAGYQFVIWDEWSAKERTTSGNLMVDARRFPSGGDTLCNYIHSKGLKCGIYTTCGPYTCQRRAGSGGHAWKDAALFASWGADYIFVDACSNRTFYEQFALAINNTGRPMVIEAHGPNPPKSVWIKNYSHLWRTKGDIQFSWASVISAVDMENSIAAYSGPGGWNYADMMEVGDAGLSLEEERSHFFLFSILASPLLAGNIISAMDNHTQALLTAPEVLSINQDKLGRQGVKVKPTPIKGPHRLELRPCNNTNIFQHWHLHPLGDVGNSYHHINSAAFTIRNNATEECMTRYACGTGKAGDDVIMFECLPSRCLPNPSTCCNQRWITNYSSQNDTLIISALSLMCLQASESDGCAQQDPCELLNSQIWNINVQTGTISTLDRKKCLTATMSPYVKATLLTLDSSLTTTPNSVWKKELANGDIAIALLNRADIIANISISWIDLDIPVNSSMHVRDTWKRRDLGVFKHGFLAQNVARHDTKLLRLSGPV